MNFSSEETALLELAHTLREMGYSFTTPTPATHERVNSRAGNEWARSINDVFGWSRPFHSSVLPTHIWALMQRANVVVAHGEGWRSEVRLSFLEGEFFFHSAYPTSAADAVFFGPDTYRFARALKSYFAQNAVMPKRIVDIGCGAGPGAIVCALAQPEAEVLALDINPKALRLARINSALAAAANVEPRESNLLRDVDGEFDLIVANPPYLVDPGERAYRHGGGPLGAGLSLAIVDAARERLSLGGTLLLYTGAAIVDGIDPFRAEVADRLGADANWSYEEMDVDVFGEELQCEAYAHADRIAAVVLTFTR
ncbi:MAG TPA: class I SAM-dependent methyltransferase [Abditibacteriaceae bacterium]|jgi:methylase of polypeptide subunit release factors